MISKILLIIKIEEKLGKYSMIIADFATIPMGTGTSAFQYVLAVHELLRQIGIKL